MLTLLLDPAILLLAQPIRKTHHLGMHFSDLPDIRLEPDIIDPAHHDPEICHHPHDALSHEAKRHRHTLAHHPLKHRTQFLERQFIPGEVDSSIHVLRIVGVDEGLRGKKPDVRGADQLDLVAGRQRRLHDGAEGLAHEARGEILHESHGPQDGVAHLGAPARLGLEVLLDVVFANEVRDVGGVGVGIGAVPLHGGVDEVVDVVGERGVDEGFALLLFGFGRGAAAEGELDAEDAPDRSGSFLEDGGAVIQVAFDELDVGGCLRERGGGCGGGVAG